MLETEGGVGVFQAEAKGRWFFVDEHVDAYKMEATCWGGQFSFGGEKYLKGEVTTLMRVSFQHRGFVEIDGRRAVVLQRAWNSYLVFEDNCDPSCISVAD